ncbi:GH92 family glycosyl hydrolase [Sediminitomix flava]|uniref:Type IV secretion system putative lipoprotein virB7 n=1 Tax=Sediminitomix flava TaxID=379075 RepID=A0A315ZXK6_SEDFL|nr:GH92 family glycosyl hydrolase [Sediminitomix flava]PWJ42077.1 putative alpha-1,2-mannosidase [Sediminitomix flava]
MKKSIYTILILFVLSACSKDNFQDEDILEYVDPFIGTGFHGHTFPGVVLPNGMVQLSPDTRVNGWDASSGYHYSDSTILGFSHTHLSGTGIGDMGDVLVLPFVGEKSNALKATFLKENESAEVGAYKVKFDNGISAELSASLRAGFHKYIFPEGETPKVQFDLGHTLQLTWDHQPISSQIEVIDAYTIRGTKVTCGWSFDDPVHFYAKFSEPIIEQVFTENGVEVKSGKSVEGKLLKLFLTFNPSIKDLKIKVGISSVSQEGAEKNLNQEIDHWDIETVKSNAISEWKKRLDKILIETADETIKKNFYTGMYHSLIAPITFQDVDGSYRGMDKKIHINTVGINYSVFSMWDTFRALHPLLTIIEPGQTGEYVKNLLQKYDEGGMLPKWPLSANYTSTMVGYPAVSIIADAFSKGLVDEKYLDKALEASIFSSEYHPEIVNKLSEKRAKTLMGLPNKYVNLGSGLIPADSTSESVSYGLEMAYYDWCISLLAQRAKNDSITEKYQERSKYYAHYFDPNTGFMRGRNADETWKEPFSPKYSNHENGDFTEGNAYQWSWFVPHDVNGLISLFGSEKLFSEKLDELFSESSEIEGEHASADITGLIGQYAHGNEPSHHTAYLYNYVGESWKTQSLIDQILYGLYSPTPEGICGNEDVGQMSAWYILNALGFYQVAPGESIYTIGRPIIDKASIQLENGIFEVEVKNNSKENKYVKEVYLNGKKLETLFFDHDEIKAGGQLLFEMTNKPIR